MFPVLGGSILSQLYHHPQSYLTAPVSCTTLLTAHIVLSCPLNGGGSRVGGSREGWHPLAPPGSLIHESIREETCALMNKLDPVELPM